MKNLFPLPLLLPLPLSLPSPAHLKDMATPPAVPFLTGSPALAPGATVSDPAHSYGRSSTARASERFGAEEVQQVLAAQAQADLAQHGLTCLWAGWRGMGKGGCARD